MNKGKERCRVIRAAPRPGLMKFGKVKLWKENRYGFIKPDDSDDDIYVHHRDITDGNRLVVGNRVIYEEDYDHRKRKRKYGLIKAVNVKGVSGVSNEEAEVPAGVVVKGMTGLVKWFDSTKGLGVIAERYTGELIFAHKSDIAHGNILDEGVAVHYDKEYHVRRGKQKCKATNITVSGGSSSVGSSDGASSNSSGQRACVTGVSETGVVKSFDSVKCYGFIVPDNGGEVLFAHRKNIVDGLHATFGDDLIEGQAVSYEKKYNARKGNSFAINISRRLRVGITEEQDGSNQTKTGILKYVDGAFIEPHDGGEDIFVHPNEILDVLSEDDVVCYDLGFDDNGNICAINVIKYSAEDFDDGDQDSGASDALEEVPNKRTFSRGIKELQNALFVKGLE